MGDSVPLYLRDRPATAPLCGQRAPKIRCVDSTRLEIFKFSEASHPQADPSYLIPFQTPLIGVGEAMKIRNREDDGLLPPRACR